MEYGTKDAFGRLRSVIMHRPHSELDLVEDPSTWGFDAQPNKDIASKEFDDLVSILKKEKVDIHLIDPDEPATPNLYYTRDLGVCTTNGIILAKFRAPFRQGEELFLRLMADKLDIPIFGSIRDAFFEAGDFVQIRDDVAALGLNRSSYSGYEEVNEFLDLTLLPVPHDRHYAHLDVLFNMVREDLAVVCEEALPSEFMDFLKQNEINYITVPLDQQHNLGCDILMLKPNRVIVGAEAPDTIKQLESEGVDVLAMEMRELKKGRGGPGCLTLVVLRK